MGVAAMSSRALGWYLAAITAALTVPEQAALADERVPTATGSSDTAALQAQGLPLGGFRLYPTLRLSAGYNDNVLYRQTDKLADESFTVAPTIDLHSQWSSNQLDANAFLRDERFVKITARDLDEYGVSAKGRLDALRTLVLGASGGYSHLGELRGGPGDVLDVAPEVEFDVTNLSAYVMKRLNRIALTAGVSGSDYRFDDIVSDGLNIDQRFRNRDVRGLNGRIEYQYSSTLDLFASGSLNRVRYDFVGAGDYDRNSHGYTVLGGIRLELTRLLDGEVGVGFLSQTFSYSLFPSFKGFTYNANVHYRPTPLTTVTLTANRGLTDSSNRQVGAVLASSFGLSVEHELLRTLVLSANVGHVNYLYRGLEENYGRFTVGAGARYRVNRYLSTVLSIDHIGQTSDRGATGRYDDNRASLSLVFAR